ncbi:MAG: biotin attachment protein [Nitrospiraceae bacterium]|nr:biotin attachment protein [Nitrospiraceae bacterium]
MDINLNDLLRHYRSHTFEDYQVETPHTGVISFEVKEGQAVEGPSGKWLQRPGTLLYIIEREKNTKRIHASWRGEVTGIRPDLEGHFVEAGEIVLSVRHRLDREEIIDRILTQVLTILRAPQQARYFLSPDISARLEKRPEGKIALGSGDEVVIMSLMKRDTVISYKEDPGMLYKVYFRSGDIVEQGAPLLGICPSDRLQYMQKVIQRIRTDWEN